MKQNSFLFSFRGETTTMKYYTVTWNRPKIYSEEPQKQESEGGFTTLQEAEKFARDIEREYSDVPSYAFQVFQSIKITESEDYEENRCGKPHNNGEGEESCGECTALRLGI
jgi:hypothetical protein